MKRWNKSKQGDTGDVRKAAVRCCRLLICDNPSQQHQPLAAWLPEHEAASQSRRVPYPSGRQGKSACAGTRCGMLAGEAFHWRWPLQRCRPCSGGKKQPAALESARAVHVAQLTQQRPYLSSAGASHPRACHECHASSGFAGNTAAPGRWSEAAELPMLSTAPAQHPLGKGRGR